MLLFQNSWIGGFVVNVTVRIIIPNIGVVIAIALTCIPMKIQNRKMIKRYWRWKNELHQRRYNHMAK